MIHSDLINKNISKLNNLKINKFTLIVSVKLILNRNSKIYNYSNKKELDIPKLIIKTVFKKFNKNLKNIQLLPNEIPIHYPTHLNCLNFMLSPPKIQNLTINNPIQFIHNQNKFLLSYSIVL